MKNYQDIVSELKNEYPNQTFPSPRGVSKWLKEKEKEIKDGHEYPEEVFGEAFQAYDWLRLWQKLYSDIDYSRMIECWENPRDF